MKVYRKTYNDRSKQNCNAENWAEARRTEEKCGAGSLIHFANVLSHRSVKNSFNRKLTTIVLKKGEAQ